MLKSKDVRDLLKGNGTRILMTFLTQSKNVRIAWGFELNTTIDFHICAHQVKRSIFQIVKRICVIDWPISNIAQSSKNIPMLKKLFS